MDEKQVLDKLKELFLQEKAQGGDCSNTHVQADDLLEEFVRSLGYVDIANAYYKLGKWYE